MSLQRCVAKVNCFRLLLVCRRAAALRTFMTAGISSAKSPEALGRVVDRGAVAHVAIWNRLLTSDEVDRIWSEGLAELGLSP